MNPSDFHNSTVILLGHGSSKNEQSATAVLEQASALRQRNIFGDVQPAFWKQEPKLLEIIKELKSPRVFFVPMFVSEGYFSESVIPKALGFGESRVLTVPASHSQWYYCKPVGSHDRMKDVLLQKARDIIREFPFPRAPKESEITLFVAGHGTVQNENSRKSIERQVELIRAMGIYAAVHAVFLEEEPKISSCYDLAATRNIIVAPFFIGEGMHSREDIPMLLGEPERIVKKRLEEGKAPFRNPTERKGKLVWYADSVGNDPALADVILERVKEAAVT